MKSDAAEVLGQWGRGEAGPVNDGDGRAIADLVLRVIEGRPNVRSVCDLGCGNGYLASRLGQRGLTVVGVDASHKELAIAREHYASETVTFRQGLFDDQLAKELAAAGAFDVAVSSM